MAVYFRHIVDLFEESYLTLDNDSDPIRNYIGVDPNNTYLEAIISKKYNSEIASLEKEEDRECLISLYKQQLKEDISQINETLLDQIITLDIKLNKESADFDFDTDSLNSSVEDYKKNVAECHEILGEIKELVGEWDVRNFTSILTKIDELAFVERIYGDSPETRRLFDDFLDFIIFGYPIRNL